MQKILAAYIRVSTEMQVERDSLINQEEMIANFARSMEKEWKVYKDAGISAKDKDRPAFQEMLRDIEEGKIETVVVTKLDRITRSLKDLIFLKEFFEEHGISFISISQNLDTSTPMGRFSFYILGLVAELEREMTAERVAEDMKGRARRGKWNGGVVPFGFKFCPESKSLTVDPQEAQVIKTIFGQYQKHKSFRNVVHFLNSTGIKTRGGGFWASTSIRRILQNPIYSGDLVYNKRRSAGKTSKARPAREHVVAEGVVDALIPKDRFIEVQEIIADQRKIPASSKSSQYLLTGLLECEHCRTRMYGYSQRHEGNDGKIYQYYRCNGHISKGSAFCSGNTIDAKFVEGAVLEELKNLSVNPEMLQDRAVEFKMRFDQEVKPLLDQQKILQQSLDRMEKKEQRLLELYEDGLINKGEFAKRKESLIAEKKLLKREVEEVDQKVYSNDLANFDLQSSLSSIRNLAEVFEELDLQERKELLRTVVSKIEVGKHHLNCHIFALPKSFVDDSRTGRGSWPRPA